MMLKLSPDHEAIVAQTAGVVAEHAEQITRVFYPDMFEAHPELLNVFNRANQAIGEQPKAVAASVVAFAVHLIDPDAPEFTPVMQRNACSAPSRRSWARPSPRRSPPPGTRSTGCSPPR